MAIGHMAEGNRPWVAATNTTIDATDLNDVFDELVLCFESRWTTLTHLAQGLVAPAANWWMVHNAGPPSIYYWTTAANPNGSTMIFPLPVKHGERITDIRAMWQDSARNGGWMQIFRRQHETAGGAAVFGGLNAEAVVYSIAAPASDPWNNGGANTIYYSDTGMTIDIDGDYEYYLKIVASTTGAGIAETFFFAAYASQFYE